jgi:hypothetical protein
MNNLPKWEDRPSIIGNLLNPAFCSEIIRAASKTYSTESKRPMPYALIFLILPFILHKPTRDCYPKSARTHFYAWLESNSYVKINIDERIKSLVPFTKEAIMFLVSRQLIEIDETGGVLTSKFIEKRVFEEDDLKDIILKSRLLGKLLARSGSVISTYAILGIKP